MSCTYLCHAQNYVMHKLCHAKKIVSCTELCHAQNCTIHKIVINKIVSCTKSYHTQNCVINKIVSYKKFCHVQNCIITLIQWNIVSILSLARIDWRFQSCFIFAHYFALSLGRPKDEHQRLCSLAWLESLAKLSESYQRHLERPPSHLVYEYNFDLWGLVKVTLC